jgi:hypothetical protein
MSKKEEKAERRRYERIPVPVAVELNCPINGITRTHTRNMSDGGLFVEKGGKPLPAVGTEISIKAIIADGSEEVAELRAKVVWGNADGVAIQFLD